MKRKLHDRLVAREGDVHDVFDPELEAFDPVIYPHNDFNSSGTRNTATSPSTGRVVVTVPNASGANASIMVTPYNDPLGADMHSCSLVSWIGNRATIECRSRTGVLVDGAFNFLYARSGPPSEQQGAHALFNGTSVDTSQSAALGEVSGCSPANVTGSRTGSLASMIVAGDLASWDASPFLRASFAMPQRTGGGFCKVQSLTSAGTAPTSTSTTTVRCYTSTGTAIAAPVFRFTHVTSDPSGPC